MSNLFALIDITKDALYVKGIKEAKLQSVGLLIINTEFDDAYIAFLMSVSVEMVNETRQKLDKKKKKNGH